jgi:hypothetical protein
MKRLALVSVIVLVSLVGTVGICLAADQVCESLLTQMAVIQRKLDALQASVARIQSRQYFLTSSFVKGNQANDTVCGHGFHFASIYEILDPTTIRYASENEYALKEPLADMGRGPPQRLYGWIRTGQYADRLNIPGSANCDAWQTAEEYRFGTVASLRQTQPQESIAHHNFPIIVLYSATAPWWDVMTWPCSIGHRVWCVSD